MFKAANESDNNSHQTKSEEDETEKSTLWEWLVVGNTYSQVEG
jgi:hypothetical protein